MDFVIRHVEKTDFEDIAEIYSFESVIARTSQPPHRGGPFWNYYYSSKGASIEIVAVAENKVVGHLGVLLNDNPRTKHICSFGVVVHPDYQGKGAGKALVSELIHLADNWLNILKIELDVFADNEIALSLYEKFGFTIEGESRFSSFKNGKFSHSFKMARLNPAQIQLLDPPSPNP